MVLIYIWRTRFPWQEGGLDWGHVAMEIPDEEFGSQVPLQYMSYWPPDKRVDKCTFNYEEDVESCGEADRVIEINGLAEEAMIKGWQDELVKDFDNLNHNCCTVTITVLRIGILNVSRSFFEQLKIIFQAFLNLESVLNASSASEFGETLVWCPSAVELIADNYLKITTDS